MERGSKTAKNGWVTRFAPSPTGYLHLGHVASAIYVFGLGRALKAEVLLRLEDHDQGRSRPAFEAAIFDDLEWLGLVPDNLAEAMRRPSPFRQSDVAEFYQGEIRRLTTTPGVYACDCSRKRIAQAQGDDAEELRYDGHCRARGLAFDQPGVGWRLATPATHESFVDGRLGPLEQEPARQCGDLLLRDRDGNFTYQFAVVVDDLKQGVNLVIRGQDLTHSTGRQLLLGRLLGRTAPAHFYHHPLLTGGDGQKLGKRVFSEAVAARRARGESAEAVLGDAAYQAGLLPGRSPLAARDLPALFASDPWLGRLAHG